MRRHGSTTKEFLMGSRREDCNTVFISHTLKKMPASKHVSLPDTTSLSEKIVSLQEIAGYQKVAESTRWYVAIALQGAELLQERWLLDSLPWIENLNKRDLWDFFYLIAVYGFKDGDVARPENIPVEEIYERIGQELVRWDSQRNTEDLMYMIQRYIWSIEMQDVAAVQYREVGKDVTKMTPLLQSPDGYTHSMRWIYNKFPEEGLPEWELLQWAHVLNGPVEHTTRDIVCYEYPEALWAMINEFSLKLRAIVHKAGIACIEYGSDNLHTSVIANAWKKRDGKRDGKYAPNMTDRTTWRVEHIVRDLADQEPPVLENLGLRVKWDSVILTTYPKWPRHLRNVIQLLKLFPYRRWWWWSHLTVARFSGVNDDPEIGKEINALVAEYSNKLKQQFPTITPSGVFVGKAEINQSPDEIDNTYIKFEKMWREDFNV